MQRNSPAATLVGHGQPSPERQHTSNSPDLEPGHQVTPAKSRWHFRLNIFNMESIELLPLTAEDVQLKDALVKLSKLCSGQETAENDSLMDITSRITSSLRSLVTANVQPKSPQRARINRILSDIGKSEVESKRKSDGKSDGFLNCFESFSNHHLIQNLNTNVFDSFELKWALFQIYWLLRHLAQNTPNRRLLPVEDPNRSRFPWLKVQRAVLSYLFMWALIFLCSIGAVGFYALGWTYAHEAPDNNWS